MEKAPCCPSAGQGKAFTIVYCGLNGRAGAQEGIVCICLLYEASLCLFSGCCMSVILCLPVCWYLVSVFCLSVDMCCLLPVERVRLLSGSLL